MIEKQEYYNGFNWCLPQAFKDSLLSFYFSKGSLLFNSSIAYEVPWEEAKKKLEYSIQIKGNFGSTNFNDMEEIDDNSIIATWDDLVEIELTDYKNNSSSQIIKTTQGKLFTFLRTGDKSNLNMESPKPKIPVQAFQIREQLNAIVSFIPQIIKNQFCGNNVFIMIFDPINSVTVEKYRLISTGLNKSNFIFNVVDIKPNECGLNSLDYFPTIVFRCIIILSNKCETVRDLIKSALWTIKGFNKPTKSILDILNKNKSSTVNHFKLSNHGVYVPSYTKKFGDLRTHSFEHNLIYRYRLAINKLNSIPKALLNFLSILFEDCPNHLFRKENIRASKTKLDLKVFENCKSEHEYISLAKDSRSFSEFNSRHENLQKYFLEKTNNFIASEIPVWIESSEIKNYNKIFNTNLPLTGHIDLLSKENDNKIGIWDYKPKAFSEKNAHVQIFLYSLMLSIRTGIKLSDFICGYFDEADLYVFNPSEVILDS